ncbi:MAG: phospholipase D family protein [Opitutaceae bacterium]|nr:phospholipase D family protein [Opitutaceae bacterium]
MVALLALAGCATPAPRPREFSGPSVPVETGGWAELGQVRPVPWFHLLNTGPEALEWRLRAIDAATSSIDLETFLWKADHSGARMLAHLLAAADRGVKVRILLDDSFTMHQDVAWRALSQHPNLALRIYNPYRRRVGGALGRFLLNLDDFARVDHRLHNKVLLVDGRLAIVGGRNVADEYFGHDPVFNFRDLDVMTLDGATREIAAHFSAFWNGNWTLPIEQLVPESARHPTLAAVRSWLGERVRIPARDAAATRSAWRAVAHSAHAGQARFIADDPARHDPAAPDEAPVAVANALRELIGRARNEVTAVSAYLIPTEKFEAALAQAEARGVSVRILTNSLRSNNHLAAHAAYRNHLHRLLRQGVDLHEVRALAKDREQYMPAPADTKRLGLHAKAIVFDDHTVYVGSCNLDPRSLRLNTEVGLVIESRTLNAALRESLALDFSPRNAWALRLVEDRVVWIGDDQTLDVMPADSVMQRLEDWFLSRVPAESEL